MEVINRAFKQYLRIGLAPPLLVLCCSIGVVGQRCQVHGHLLDGKDAIIPGMTLSYKGKPLQGRQTVAATDTSDEQGNYKVRLAPGIYEPILRGHFNKPTFKRAK